MALARIAIINPADGTVTIRDPSTGAAHEFHGLSGCAESIAILQQHDDEWRQQVSQIFVELNELHRALIDGEVNQLFADRLAGLVDRMKSLATR